MILKYNIEKQLLLKVYAHKNEDVKELLSEHSSLTLSYAQRVIELHDYEYRIKKLLKGYLDKNNYSLDYITFLYELFLLAIYYHDIGKINPLFQFSKTKMDNDAFKNIKMTSVANHSVYSMYIFNYIAYKEYLKFNEDNNLEINREIIGLIYSFGIIISKHHSSLKDFTGSDTFISINQNIKEDIFNIEIIFGLIFYNENYEKYFNSYKVAKMQKFDENIYILLKILNSLIVSSDFYATSEFMNNKKHEFNLISDVSKLYNIYKENNIFKTIDLFKNNKYQYEKNDINKLRTEMFLEAERNIKKKSNFYYLEAPTGAGKTNISINLALKLIEKDRTLKKVFYVFPFNTLVEQTYCFLNEMVFQEKVELGIINSVFIPDYIKDYEYDEKPNYIKEWNLNNLMYNYKINLTSHVNFFNTILGCGKESQYAFIHMANSVVIIDEIQSYKNILWDKIIVILDMISNIFNMKFIIMSATLPNLNKLLPFNNKIINLLEEPTKYYQNNLFLDRVKLDFSLLNIDDFNLNDLKSKVLKVFEKNYTKVLVEFINKKMAREFYQMFFENDFIIYEITGNDSAYFKRKMIDNIKKMNNKVLVISTQVIEAGVDIDFDIGFKHYSILDSEEQFLGRINRSCKKENSIAYFFKIGDIGIYRNDYRKYYSILEKECRELLTTKNFKTYYELVLNNLKQRSSRNDKVGINSFYSIINQLKYQEINNDLKLINSFKGYSVFIDFIYVDENNNKIIGNEIFSSYENIIYSDLSYDIKKFKLKLLKEKMSIFTFEIIEYDSEGKLIKEPKGYNKKMGDIYYFNDKSEFIEINNFIAKLDYGAFLNDCFI